MMKKEVLFVEFFGLPGAGKTTIGNAMVQKLNASGHKTYSLNSLIRRRSRQSGLVKGFHLLLFILKNFRLSAAILKLSVFFRPLNLESFKFAYAAVRMVFKIEQAKKNAFVENCSVIVFDQGVLQDLWSAGVTGIPENSDSIETYLKKMLDLIHNKIRFRFVFFDVKPEIAVKRIQNRSSRKYRFERMDLFCRETLLQKKSAYLSLIVKTAADLKNCKSLALDNNTEDNEVNTEKVYAFITNELRFGPDHHTPVMNKQLKIVFAIRDVLAIGGAQLNALRLATKIHESGCRVLIIGHGSTEEIEKHLKAFGLDSTIPIFPVSMPKGFLKKTVTLFPNAYFWIPCFYRLWRMKNQFDILHCPLLMDSVIICAFTEMLLGKSSIIKIGSGGPYGDVSRASQNTLSRLIRLLIRKISVFVCMTEEIETEIRTEFNLPGNRIVRIPNGIDTKIYSGMTVEEKIEFRHSLGIPEERKVVLFVGRLEKKKRVDFLIRAWSRIISNEDKNSPCLLIAGDGTLRKELENLCRKLAVEKTVMFYGNTNKIPSIMQVSNIFVLPSVSEGAANVILEAMSSGLPIVATNTKGNAEILTHGVDALLFEENDLDDLANKILFFFDNEDAADGLCNEARRKVTEQFSIRSVTEQYLDLYHRLTYDPIRTWNRY